MNPIAHSKKWLFFALITLSLVISACSAAPTHEWLEAPDWGRARLMGTTISGYPMRPAIDNEGNVYFAFSHIEANVPIISVSGFDEKLDFRWNSEIALERLNRANRPTIVLSNKGLEVFWIFNGSLFSVIYSTDGEQLSEAQRISGSRAVSHYDVSVTPQGDRIAWFSGDRTDPGLFYIDPPGNIVNVDKHGYRPQIVMSADSGMHVTWLRNEAGSILYEFFYAQYPESQYVQDQERHVYTLTLVSSTGLNGPELALDDHNVYFLWSQISRSGNSAGSVSSKYVTMPHDGETTGSPIDLSFPYGYNLNYSPFDDFFQVGARALPENLNTRTRPTVIESFANSYQASELVVSVRSNIPYLRNKTAHQIGLAFFNEGQITSFQLLSFTPGNSELSTIQADSGGYLHSSWLEQNQGNDFRVYYSSTRPEAKAALNELGQEDAIRLGGNTLFGLLSGLALIPVTLLWGLGPVLVFFFLGFLRNENEPITAPGTLTTLLAAVSVFTFIKLFTLPSLTTHVPFSGWIPILPAALGEILRVVLPIGIGLFALFMAWRGTYGRKNNSPLFFIFYFILWDGIPTIAIYGGLFFGSI